MSDLIKGMFADKLKEWGMSAARGINPTGVVGGTVDLINLIPRGVNAALGLGYEEQLSKPFLGTGWMEDRGLLQKEQPGLDNTIVEMGAGMLGGGGALRGVVKGLGGYLPDAIPGTIPKSSVYTTRGESTGNIKDLNKEREIRNSRKWGQEVNAIYKTRDEDIEKIVRNFMPDVSRIAKDSTYGRLVQRNMKTYMKAKDAKYKAENAADFDKALSGGRDKLVVPPTPTAYQEVMDKIKNERRTGDDQAKTEVLDWMEQEAARLFNQPQALGNIKQNLQASVRELSQKNAADPYSKATFSDQKEYERWFAEGYRTQLDEAAKTMPEAQDLVTARSNFAQRRQERDHFLDNSLIHFFSLKDKSDLTPQKITDKLMSMERRELDFFTKIADDMDVNMAEQLRAKIFDDLVNKAKNGDGNDLVPEFAPQKFIREYKKMAKDKPEVLDFIRPKDPAMAKKFDEEIEMIKKTTNDASMLDKPKGASQAIAGGLGVGSGVPGASMVYKGLWASLMDRIPHSESTYRKHFGPQPDPTIKTQQPNQMMQGVKAGAAVGAGREIGGNEDEVWADPIRVTAQEESPFRATPALPTYTPLSEEDFGGPSAPAPAAAPTARPASTGYQPLTEEDFN